MSTRSFAPNGLTQSIAHGIDDHGLHTCPSPVEPLSAPSVEPPAIEPPPTPPVEPPPIIDMGGDWGGDSFFVAGLPDQDEVHGANQPDVFLAIEVLPHHTSHDNLWVA
jgi:hypothetical protein